MDNEIVELERQVEEKKKQEIELFKQTENDGNKAVAKTNANNELVENMFNQAVVHEVANNAELNKKVLTTAKKFTETKMQTIGTDVDTEHKAAVFNNNKDACECYGCNETTTPTWAVNFMKVGYNSMLGIYLFVAAFTIMPVLFLGKKIQVAVKKTWIAILLAFLIYAAVVFTPIITALVKNLIN